MYKIKNRITSLIVIISISIFLSSYMPIIYSKATGEEYRAESYAVRCDICHNDEWIQFYYTSRVHTNMTCEDCHIVTTEISPHNVTTLECIYCHPEVGQFNDHKGLTVEGKFTGDNGKCLACHSNIQIPVSYTKYDTIKMTITFENGNYKIIYDKSDRQND